MKIVAFFLATLITTANLLSDITYPKSIESSSKIDNGRLLFDDAEDLDNKKFYLLSTN